MTAQDILDAIQRLDIEQGQWYDRYYKHRGDPVLGIPQGVLFDHIDMIDDERRKYVQWYQDEYGPLPEGVTETY